MKYSRIKDIFPLFALLAFSFSFGLTACNYDKKETLYPQNTGTICDTTNITYGNQVRNILNASCTSCHNTSSPSGGVILDTHSGVVSNKEKMLGSVKHAAGFSAMPQNAAKLSDCQIAQLDKWVQAGAPNN